MLPAGKYYVGDLCYVMHDKWNEVCDLTLTAGHGMCLEGEFVLKDGGIIFAMHSTKWGDGEYMDNTGRRYPVDAGLIGCILVSNISESELVNLECGNVIDFTESFRTYNNDGIIHIGDVLINTDLDESYYDSYGEEIDYPTEEF
jgi:hypothetical protein